jgi:uncharacterized protein YaaN involved in tellurite resistance
MDNKQIVEELEAVKQELTKVKLIAMDLYDSATQAIEVLNKREHEITQKQIKLLQEAQKEAEHGMD